MTHTITTNISNGIYDFLNDFSKKTKRTKRQILEEALDMYRKQVLEEEIKKGFEKNYSEYIDNIDSFGNLQFDSIKGI